METSTTGKTNSALLSQPLIGELKQISQIITQTVDVEKIICFGSICHRMIRKSCFEEQEHASSTLTSSYNLLVIPSTTQPLADVIVQQQVEEAVKPIAETTVIVHTMREVNAALESGSTFFTTLCKKGIVLHDGGKVPFHTPGKGNPVAKRITRREQFWNKWHDLAQGFLQGAVFYQRNGRYRLAVYLLHQAVQHCYCGVLRVTVGYRTNAQSLNRLLRLIDTTVHLPSLALPRQTPGDIRLMEMLLKGYSDARYKDTFDISEEEVATLVDRVSQLTEMANRHCRVQLQQLKDGERTYTPE